MSSAIGWIGVAVVGSAVVGAGASIYSANKTTDAMKDASEKSFEATGDTNKMLHAQYEQTREDQEPWRIAGEQALSAIQNTPDFEFTAESFDLLKDPSYDFRMQEGVNALDRSAASRGRLLSGSQDRAVTRYGSDLASQEYGNAFNRAKTTFDTNLNTQKSLAGVGQQAVNATTNAGLSTTQSIASNTMAGTQAQNALTMQGAETQGQMATNIATSANQGMGNYLLATKYAPATTATTAG